MICEGERVCVFSVHAGERSGTMSGVVLPLVFQLADRTVWRVCIRRMSRQRK